MNKLQMIEAVQNKLGGGRATEEIKAQYRSGVIKMHLGIAFNDLIVRVYQNSINGSISDLDAYTKVYPIPSIHTSDLYVGKKYIEIPTTTKKLLQLPNNNAIRHIWTTEDPPRECLYRELGMETVYNQLEASAYLTNPRYEVIGDNIYFDSRIGNAVFLVAYLIVPFEEFTDEEDLPAPLENNNTIIEEVYMKMLNTPPEDTIMDDKVVRT